MSPDNDTLKQSAQEAETVFHDLDGDPDWVTYEEAEKILGVMKRRIQQLINEKQWQRRTAKFNNREYAFLFRPELIDFLNNDRNLNSKNFQEDAGPEKFTTQELHRETPVSPETFTPVNTQNRGEESAAQFLVPFQKATQELSRTNYELSQRLASWESKVEKSQEEFVKEKDKVVRLSQRNGVLITTVFFLTLGLSGTGIWYWLYSKNTKDVIVSKETILQEKESLIENLKNENLTLKGQLIETSRQNTVSDDVVTLKRQLIDVELQKVLTENNSRKPLSLE